MKTFDIDWPAFLEALRFYERLSIRAREALIANGTQNQVYSGMGNTQFDELLENGMYFRTPGGRHIALSPEYRGFVKAMRAMHRSRIDLEPNAITFDAYIADNFSREQWTALQDGYWMQSRNDLYRKISGVKWIESFLASEGLSWRPQVVLGFDAPADRKAQAQSLKKVIRHLMASPDPLAFNQLPRICPDLDALGPAISEGLARALLFPMLRRDTLEPLLGLWPEISARLHRPAAKPPQAVRPVHTFCVPLFIDEEIAVITAAAAEPLKLITHSFLQPYQKSEKQIAARLLSLPEWLAAQIKIDDHYRICGAIERLVATGRVRQVGDKLGSQSIEPTDGGLAWLALSANQRLKTELDRFRTFKCRQTNASYESYELAHVTIGGEGIDVKKVVGEALMRIPGGESVRALDFVIYESRVQNPLAAALKSRSFRRIEIRGSYHIAESDAEIEELWADLLVEILLAKLMPLGAIEAGVTEQGDLTIRVSEAGRYLFGLIDDLSIDSREPVSNIVVQPNFDIVFMAPAPLAEAVMSRFAERQGKHVGSVLKITKKSVWAAAAAGMTAEEVLETLRTHASVAIPANVQREIRGWIAQCRRVSTRPAVLIQCPDAETAARVLAANRANLSPLTDTVLELSDATQRGRLVKKLREMGIFVSAVAVSSEAPQK